MEVCPAKSKSDASHKAINMEPQAPLRSAEAANVALLPLRRGGGEGSIRGQRADRQRVATSGGHCAQHVAHKGGRGGGNHRKHVKGCGDLGGQLHAMQMRQRRVNGGIILLHHSLAALAIGFLNGQREFLRPQL